MKKFLWLLLAFLIILGAIAYIKLVPMIKVVSGYSAKCICSNEFITGRSQKQVESIDLTFLPLSVQTNVDRNEKVVTSSLYGLGKQKVAFREDLGCVLIKGNDDFNTTYDDPIDEQEVALPYPYGDVDINEQMVGVDYNQLNTAVENAFDPNGEYTSQKTRALLVIYKDTLIAEKYGLNHDKNSRIIGWSMTKSIMNTLIGMLVKEGKLSIEDDHLFPEWEDDDRKTITINNLLQMTSGLDWNEVYDQYADATELLYDSDDVVKRAIRNPLKYQPGTHWYYSSGTSNILSGIIRKQFATQEAYHNFLHQQLFNHISMDNALIETDEAGNFIGSSFGYATARDWGRYGTLYLHDGVWNGERLLPEGWVDYTKSAAPDSKGEYGAQFWLNKDKAYFPDVPEDMYSANGFQGQKVAIIPSKDLVIVRLGFNSEFDFNTTIRDIIAALP